ncbi:MAG: hypothetical protein ABSH28_17300, partial [Acidobacteriota bacterium]
MDRRRFLQSLAVTAACFESLSEAGSTAQPEAPAFGTPADVEGHTFLCEFRLDQTAWKVYEDLRTRDGVLTFVSSSGVTRVMRKSGEAAFPEAAVPYLGLSLNDIGLSGPDLLADMHDISLKLPQDDAGHGLISGWSESDACLAATPEVWWQLYYANSAFSARGLRDIGRAWLEMERWKPAPAMQKEAQDWLRRSQVLQDATVASIEK